MIVTYKPGGAEEKGAPIVKQTVDLAAPAVAKYGEHLVRETCGESAAEDTGKMDEVKEKMRNRLHLTSGETEGEAEMPVTCAPLIYPALERTGQRKALEEDEAGNKRVDQRSAEFVGDYFDRRARMIEANRPNIHCAPPANHNPIGYEQSRRHSHNPG